MVLEGSWEGVAVGAADGEFEGKRVGGETAADGRLERSSVGKDVGSGENTDVGFVVCAVEGRGVGVPLVSPLGKTVGSLVG
jgi:hypothetical protein